MVAAPFCACITFALLMGYMFIAATTLEEGVREAGRQIRVGNVDASSMSKSDFEKLICDYVSIPKDTCQAKIVVDLDSAANVESLPEDTPHADDGSLDESKSNYNPGGSSEYVLLKAYLPMDSLTSLFTLLGDDADRGITISSATVFRNEPF